MKGSHAAKTERHVFEGLLCGKLRGSLLVLSGTRKLCIDDTGVPCMDSTEPWATPQISMVVYTMGASP